MLKTDSSISFWDRTRGILARWGFGRARYRVLPDLYALGRPGPDSPVFVSANYKLSFDVLRGALDGMDAWILVLNTRGINVWCAAGKGTFGTKELAWRIAVCDLGSVVRHRTLIVPQLGAPGVSAHEVAKQTGFRVVYGPVRAQDIKTFLKDGMKADQAMRTVSFPATERLMLTPIESLQALKYFLAYAALAAIWFLGFRHGNLGGLLAHVLPILGAVLTGTVLVPALLPWLPPRSFALKGWTLGLLWAGAAAWFWPANPLVLLGEILALPALSAFLALNFTGSTTFTSPSGVNREISLFARPMAVSFLAGLVLLIAGRL
ncbi:MAG: mercury methylation corrinoid protein HgcA [Elusimicrobia bacterium]|nr:mercury methylation corrinoid protein HgcA [Elusimicrobiota bacterium]